MEHNLITKSNILIRQTIDDLNKREQYLMAVLLSEFKEINYNSDCFDYDGTFDTNEAIENCEKTVTLRLTEFINYLGITDGGKNLDNYKNIISHFQSRAFFVWLDDKYANRTPMFSNIQIPKHWIDNNIPFDEKEYDINFTFSDNFIKHLLVSDNFTKLFKESILNLKSEKAIKLYQLLKSHANQQYDVSYSIDDLKVRLNMTSKSYNRFCDFYKRGIVEPLNDINKNTEILVKVKKNHNKKDKRKIDSLTFNIRNQGEKKIWWQEYPHIKLSDDEYKKVTQWIVPVHHKPILKELEDKLEAGIDIRNHFKWLNSRYMNKIKNSCY